MIAVDEKEIIQYFCDREYTKFVDEKVPKILNEEECAFSGILSK